MKISLASGLFVLLGLILSVRPVAASVGSSGWALFVWSDDGSWTQQADPGFEPTVSADLDGDGLTDTLAAAARGQTPNVTINWGDGREASELPVFDSGMFKGFDLAVGDFDGDGSPDLAVAAGPETNGHVRLLGTDGQAKIISNGIFPFGLIGRSGSFVAAGDVDSDGMDELLVGSGPGIEARVQVLGLDGRGFLGEFSPFGDSSPYGARPAVGDFDGDGRNEIAVAGAYGGGEVALFDGLSFDRLSDFRPFGEADESGLEIAVDRSASGGSDRLLVRSRSSSFVSRPWLPQYVRVDVSEQRLYAYEFGQPVGSFLVSTGKVGYATPLGEFSALAKPEYVHYAWSYGDGNPNNYDLGVVRWNIRFLPHLYIHYAPWHNNFGRRMSHGCVNVNRTNAEWIYGWLDVGTPITVTE
ncbi:MAG: L,D-transpeptidase family protein [bacterium]